jgi:rRNA maturation RNase YbeY
MLSVEIFEKKFRRDKTTVVRTAKWLMRRFRKGGFYLEISLVGNKLMPKNVLAFPTVKGFPIPGIRQRPLGEIYLNPSVIRAQEWTLEFMTIHGFLHLLGYDHKKKSDRMKMERLEQKLLAELAQ